MENKNNIIDMLKYKIHPDFPELEELILSIKETFSQSGTTIYKIRNEVKIIEFKGKKLCIKSFGKPNIINYFVYSFIRASKAKRSFENAVGFLNIGIDTPKPIAFVEIYNKKGLLRNSYYISLYDEHLFTMEEVMQGTIQEHKQIINEFAAFAKNQLHKKGILHLDFGGNNILVKKDNANSYKFSIIDLNRIKKRKQISFKTGLHNLIRLNGSALETTMLAIAYANACNEDAFEAAAFLLNCRVTYLSKRNFRRSFFKPVKKYFISK